VIAAYVSGHGFGHATRVGEVLRHFRKAEPLVPIAISSAAPEALFRAALGGPFLFRSLACDVGLAQRDALTIDLDLTASHCREFARVFPALVRAEAAWLLEREVRLVLGDIPPLASAAATSAGLPSLALGNFSWDWIYRHFATGRSALKDAAGLAAGAYAGTSLLLELPFAGDLGVFPKRRKIPLIARRPRFGRDEVRARLGALGKPLVLWSFGGLGLPGFDPARLATLTDFRFLMVGEGRALENVLVVPQDRLEELSLSYVDLVGAADVVVTKPGYGIVSDALGARSRLLYTDRGDFPEYPILVREMAPLLPTRHVSQADLLGGRLRPALEALLAAPFPPAPDLSGAGRAAEAIRELLSG
jgi:hypothetical protein